MNTLVSHVIAPTDTATTIVTPISYAVLYWFGTIVIVVASSISVNFFIVSAIATLAPFVVVAILFVVLVMIESTVNFVEILCYFELAVGVVISLRLILVTTLSSRLECVVG